MDKDIKRVQDLLIRAKGDHNKVLNLAQTMANSITDYNKAKNRAEAAISYLCSPLGDKVNKIFINRCNDLSNASDVLEVKTPEITNHNTIYVPSGGAALLWKWEIQGQLSDGAWENSRPLNHWVAWCSLNVDIGEPRYHSSKVISKDNYNLHTLKQYIGDRMLKFGRFGKANPGAHILGDSVNCTIEDLPDEPILNFSLWKKRLIEKNNWRSANYYWKGLTKEMVDNYYKTSYTERELNQDLKFIKQAMKNRIHK